MQAKWLRTRKWGCALGITLLIAVPVVLAVWLGQMLMKPRSAIDMLRSIPLYAGARDAHYTYDEDMLPGPQVRTFASVAYRVDDAPDAVYGHYRDALKRDGWALPIVAWSDTLFEKAVNYFDGLYLSERPPWIWPKTEPVGYDASFEANQVTKDGETFTEVKFYVETRSGPVP